MVEFCARPVEIAFGQIGVLVGDVGADIVDRQAIGGERARIDLDAQRRPLAAGDRHQADAGNLRHFLRQPDVHKVLDLGQRQGLRGDGEDQDRRVGGIDLGVDRRRRQAGGQQAGRGVDRRLHLLLRDVELISRPNCSVDHRSAGRTDRTHLVQARHLAELPLQRRGHRRRHHLRTGAGIEGRNLDGGIIDLRQGRNRQEAIGDDARPAEAPPSAGSWRRDAG